MLETLSRRGLLHGGAALALTAVPLASCGRNTAARADTVRIGYQKDGVLVIAKQQKRLEQHLAASGIGKVEWAEFPSGPPLLEALAAGGIDFGATGDTPPIFAQASGTDLVYVAAVPVRGRSSAILLPPSSKISRIADLKGGRVAFTRGSSAHYFAVSALHSAGLTLSDVTPIYLAPSDARAAFVRGSLDAWFIWDPYYADAERNAGARVLSNAEPFVHSASFFLASRAFAERNPGVVRAILDELCTVGQWIAANRAAASELVSKINGLDLAIVSAAFARADFGIVPLDAGIIARQQDVADDFARLGIIPHPVKVADAVAHLDWK
ncbi:MAG: aliphatic sulfonate ABC transporter substrate-binding protein [Rhizomicrobium sp.]